MIALTLLTSARADSLDLNEKTWSLGGSATANIVLGDDSDVFLALQPTAGYFVADRLELLLGLSLFVDDGYFGVGFFGGVDYFFSDGPMAPYVGGTLGYGTSSFDLGPFVAGGDDVVTLSGRGGLLFPLNKKVGFDLGARLNVNVSEGETYVVIPLGYLGIRAFFP